MAQIDNAKSNAARALITAETDNTDNPTTRVHELAHFFETIKDKNGEAESLHMPSVYIYFGGNAEINNL